MCSHVIASSEFNGDLAEFMKWYRSNRGMRPPSLSNLGQFGMPQGAGRKGGKLPERRSLVNY